MTLESILLIFLAFLLGGLITAFGYTYKLGNAITKLTTSPLFREGTTQKLVEVCVEHDGLMALADANASSINILKQDAAQFNNIYRLLNDILARHLEQEKRVTRLETVLEGKIK